MGIRDRDQQFVYAFTMSTAPARVRGGPELVGGIAVALKDRQRRTMFKCGYAVPAETREAAGYEAIAIALREARAMGYRSISAYSADHRVVAQINREAEAAAENTARYLEVRALMNQFRWAQVRPAGPDVCYGLHALAERAMEGLPTAESHEQLPQLSLSLGE